MSQGNTAVDLEVKPLRKEITIDSLVDFDERLRLIEARNEGLSRRVSRVEHYLEGDTPDPISKLITFAILGVIIWIAVDFILPAIKGTKNGATQTNKS